NGAYGTSEQTVSVPELTRSKSLEPDPEPDPLSSDPHAPSARAEAARTPASVLSRIATCLSLDRGRVRSRPSLRTMIEVDAPLGSMRDRTGTSALPARRFR